MPRRWIETLLAVLAVAALGLVLYNATLVDRRPPTVSRISLSATADGDEHVAQTLTAIDLAFSEPVDRASVEQRFRIEPYVGGTFTWDRDTTAIFTPARKLPSATPFRVIVAAGFLDPAGNPAADPAGPFEFTTVGAPVVLSMTPAAGTTGVATDSAVVLAFDRLMDTGSVETALTVEPSATYRVSWSGPSLTLAFDRPLGVRDDVYGERVQRRRRHRRQPSRRLPTTALHDGRRGPRRRRRRAGRRRGRDRRSDPIAVMFDGPIDPASVEGAIRITPEIGGDIQVVQPPATPPSHRRRRTAARRHRSSPRRRTRPGRSSCSPRRARCPAHDLYGRARADRRASRRSRSSSRWPDLRRSRPAARRRAPRTRSRSCPTAAGSGTSG